MSCSQFIEHEDEDKSDTLVIIVNGDGTVTVDPRTLERVLNNQCRAAVSVIKLEDSNEPDSQTGEVRTEKNEKLSDEKESFRHKVNLVVEGYYPPPPLNTNSKSKMSTDSVVSSTVGTPPLPQTSSEFLDLLAEGLNIPVSQSNVQTTVEGCIGDSLVDAFSEMAPEQLKQVETALHSEKAKQILGDGVTSVLDTLKMTNDIDDWVHLDHCYTANYYGSRKTTPASHRVENIFIQDSEDATMTTIKMKSDSEFPTTESDPCEIEEIGEAYTESGLENSSKSAKMMSKKVPVLMKADTDANSAESKKTVLSDVKSLIHKGKRSPIHIISKVKKKSASKNDLIESVPERIVKDDEVDGVKVFKPCRADKKTPKPLLLKDVDNDATTSKVQLVQTKLSFNKKEDSSIVKSKAVEETTSPKQVDKNVAQKKDNTRKSVTPEVFGPALFSTPDIIRKIGSEDTPKESCNVSAIDTADLEKRMSAIENGEILEHITLPFVENTAEKIIEKNEVRDDSRLLSDLENSADEASQAEEMIFGLSGSASNFESSRKKSSASESSNLDDEDDVEYEDDPNKLWCICNKPHNNRFMICCDACDNWFHGYCVGITKAMGEKMEQNGAEWLCPSCKKEKTANERETKQKLSTRSVSSRNASKRRSSQTAGDSSASNISASSTPVMSPVPQNTTSEKSANQSASARRKSSFQPQKAPSVQLCIECKENEAFPEGLYCSNACIVRYVAASVENMNKGLAEPLPEYQKIIVHDKKRDQLITGMRGPSISELTSWLADHPSFEIVKPSAFPIFKSKPLTESPKTPVKQKEPQITTTTKTKVEAAKVKSTETGESSQTNIKQFFASKNTATNEDKTKMKKSAETVGNVIIKDGNASKTNENKKDHVKAKEKQRQIKLIPVQPIQKPVEEQKPSAAQPKPSVAQPKPSVMQQKPNVAQQKPATPVVKKPSAQTPTVEKTAVKRKAETPLKKDKPAAKKPEIKRQDSKKEDETSPTEPAAPSGASERERIRKSIRVALNELFILRIKDTTDINIKAEELTQLATQIEEELFNLFNDISAKYKSKYRSLRFNIKDEKNTLFRRIAEKSLKPYDLVRLTPEELASTELAQWRQREAKHEIDMIKKTELENLNQAKVLVLKTHKGELEIEPEALPTVPDTVVPDLQPDEMPIEADKNKKSLTQVLSKDKLKSDLKSKDSSKDSSKKDRDKDRHRKHDHKDKHKSSSSKHRHRSRSRRRSRSKERAKSSEKDHRSRSSTDKKPDGKSSEKDRHRSRNEKRRSRSRSRRTDKSPEKKEETSAETTETPKNESPSTDAVTEKGSGSMIINKEDEKIAAEILSSYNPVDVDLSDMEPTSTVTIQTPPYAASPELPSHAWKGTLIMPDVTKLHARLKEVSGNCEGLDEDLPSVIDCVGRINPNMVWEYISKTKKIGSREILVLRFEPVDDEQRANYFTLYSYLNRKDRMAVVGSTSPSIKDFYVIPLAGHSPIPQVLLPLDGPGFEDSRSHMLLGVIVRSRRYSHMSGLLPSSLPSVSHSKKDKEPYIPPSQSYANESSQGDTFTPPHSPTSVFVGAATATVDASPPSTETKNDDDEPYSPEDDEPYSPGALDEEHENDSMELQREVEALNRKIEEQRQQIESISSSLPQEETNEVYSPSEHFSAESESASNVQLPGDLQQLLNSLNRRSNNELQSNSATDPIVDAYKNNQDNSDEENEEELPPLFILPDEEKEEPEAAEGYNAGPGSVEAYSPETVMAVQDIPPPVESPKEQVDESRFSRDPRRKQAAVSTATLTPAVESFQMLTALQPPPPGMEDEFGMSGDSVGMATTKTDVTTSIAGVGTDPVYATAVPTASYVFPTNAPITAFPPPGLMSVPPLYMAAPGVYPQATALPFAPIPAFMQATPVLPTDPSMIPLPVEPGDGKNALKRKSQDDDRDKERRSNNKNKKYHRDSKSPPGRDGSNYDSHHRGYRRDDVEYGGGHSRYGHRHDRSYHQSRSRSNYWKGGSDYSSSGRRKYSDRRSSSRERSTSKHGSGGNRWDNSSKHLKDEWDDEIHKFESQKRDKTDRRSESSSSSSKRS